MFSASSRGLMGDFSASFRRCSKKLSVSSDKYSGFSVNPTHRDQDLVSAIHPSASNSSYLLDMLRFVVGTYTRLLYGVDVDLKKNTSKPIWLFEAHEKGLTALAVDGIHLASTSGDETIKIYDHTKNIQIADVSVPTDVSNACVRYMRFTKKHLLACHDNGQITMWSRDSWLLVHVLKSSSSKGITGIAVHPSEKLALTVGGDGKLRLWDLVRGKGSKVVGLERAGELVDFLNDETFIVMSRTSVEAFNFNIESLYTYKSKSQLNTMCFYKDKIAVGQGDGKISILDASNGELLKQLDTKQKRVKALYAACGYLVSASSDGIVKIWNDKWECVAEHKVPEGNRVTCMVAMEALTSAVPKPQKRVSQSESESDSESSSSESEDESAEEKTETKVKAKRANKKKRVD